MKSWCVRDHSTGHVLKVFLTEEEFKHFLNQHPYIEESNDCVECDDASSITLE